MYIRDLEAHAGSPGMSSCATSKRQFPKERREFSHDLPGYVKNRVIIENWSRSHLKSNEKKLTGPIYL